LSGSLARGVLLPHNPGKRRHNQGSEEHGPEQTHANFHFQIPLPVRKRLKPGRAWKPSLEN
jgi:hypothetical protein